MSHGKRLISAATAALSLLFAPLPAQAQSQPAVQVQNGIEFVSGGVGNAEVEALQRIAGRFNLKLQLTDTDGAYVDGAQIRVRVPQGYSVLDTQANGPLFYANLQPGRYQVEASYNGTVQSRSVDLTASGQEQVSFRWQADPGITAADRQAVSPSRPTTPAPAPSQPAPAATPTPEVGIPVSRPAVTSQTRPTQAAANRQAQLPQLNHAYGVAYLSGGVDQKQKQEMLSLSDRYNLKIRFERSDGSLVLDVPVVITDAVGNEYLSGTATGPWLFVNVPPGVYRIAVRDFDRSQRARITLQDNQTKTLTFTWSPNGNQAGSPATRPQTTIDNQAEARNDIPEIGIPVRPTPVGPGNRAEYPPPEQPTTQNYEGVPFITGGVGDSSEFALRSKADQYNLQLSFAQFDGDYVSGAEVTVISKSGGTVLRATAEGPLLYARVEPGDYSITAVHEGVKKRQEVNVPAARSKRVLFFW